MRDSRVVLDKNLVKRSIHADAPDADIIKELSGNPLGEHSVSFKAEMSSRLRRALLEYSESSERWARRLFWATVAVAVLTVVLVIVAIETAYLAWVLLARTT